MASGQIGSGNVGGMSWRMTVTLGPDGECFSSQLGPAGAVGGASICAPVDPPAGAVIWYPGTVNARTAHLLAHLSNGTTSRLVTAVKLTRLTLYDIHRHVLAGITPFPRVK